MAGSQFATPKSVSPSRPVRRFSLAEAIKSLPLVRRVVSDIVRKHTEIAKLQATMAHLGAKDQPTVQQKIDLATEQLKAYVSELRGIGCEVKDYQTGLVDFIGRHQGHDVCLCWKLGEETIGYWHEKHAGFAGRQSVSTLRETA